MTFFLENGFRQAGGIPIIVDRQNRDEQAMAAIKRMAVLHVRVRCGGHIQEITVRELGIPAVVGCGSAITLLQTGDRVCVDGGQGMVEIQGNGRSQGM